MSLEKKTSRRSFIKGAALASAAFTIVPRPVLGKGFTAPSDKLNVGVIGSNGKGFVDATQAAAGGANIGAICDVHLSRANRLLDALTEKPPVYQDWRKMLDERKDLDAVTVSTPDHNHAVITLAAMQNGLHTYVQKPLTHSIHEARVLTEAARKHRIVTQMGNQGASGDGVKTMMRWFDDGLIGKVDTVHVWTNRPVWPQAIPTPTDAPAKPDDIDWDLWIGPAGFRDYHPDYHPFSWRGWWNFGTGALGDMGCHLMDPPYRVLGLGYPSAVESSVSTNYTARRNMDWYTESCPAASVSELTFPASEKNPSEVKLTWSDGGIRPFRPDIIPADHWLGEPDNSNGVIMIGDKGVMVCGTYARYPKVYLYSGEVIEQPEEDKTPTVKDNGHQMHWVKAAKAGFGSAEQKALTSGFDYAGPFTEAILMGNLGIRSTYFREKNAEGKTVYPGRRKLLWDGDNMRITNFDPANQFVRRSYREGWNLGQPG